MEIEWFGSADSKLDRSGQKFLNTSKPDEINNLARRSLTIYWKRSTLRWFLHKYEWYNQCSAVQADAMEVSSLEFI